MRLIDLTGQRFGRLVVSRRAECGGKKPLWHCVCDCGVICLVRGYRLRSGETRSCGCLSDETRARPRSHGLASKGTRSPEYEVWRTMRARCANPNVPCYEYYGGRGIKVCERWSSFANFIADMGARPTAEHSIDRRDVNGDYTPSNCEWVTAKHQQRNRRNNRTLTYCGRTLTVAEWAETLGVKQRLLLVRLSRGWSVERTLSTGVTP